MARLYGASQISVSKVAGKPVDTLGLMVNQSRYICSLGYPNPLELFDFNYEDKLDEDNYLDIMSLVHYLMSHDIFYLHLQIFD